MTITRWGGPPAPALFRAGNLFDDPDGDRHEDDDDRREGELPSALSPRVGFFRSHGSTSHIIIGLS
jgi:hypothetical protein